MFSWWDGGALRCVSGLALPHPAGPLGERSLPLSQILAVVLTVCLFLACHASADGSDPWKIGIEGKVSATLGRNDYQPKPLDDRTPLVLRIERVTPAPDGQFTYEFHYMGLEPGDYRLADYLVRPDGSAAVELGDATVTVNTILPPDHDGALNTYVPRPFPWMGGYRMLLAALAALWIIGFVIIARLGRRKLAVAAAPPPPPPLTYAERMRPLLEAAAGGTLDTGGQAELERLMTGYWRQKLALPDHRMNAALAELRAHPEAGSLILALERWLHRPGGADPEEINNLLEPYRHLAADDGKEAVA
ncbi:MAG: hypothetical protein MUF04_00850 [Akkermansiaceae bacterium]|nr:hypothetical protein [Akkermansiaceae bacterium]